MVMLRNGMGASISAVGHYLRRDLNKEREMASLAFVSVCPCRAYQLRSCMPTCTSCPRCALQQGLGGRMFGSMCGGCVPESERCGANF